MSWHFPPQNTYLHVRLLQVSNGGVFSSASSIFTLSVHYSLRHSFLVHKVQSCPEPSGLWSLQRSRVSSPLFLGLRSFVFSCPQPGFVERPPTRISCFPLLMSFLFSCLGTSIFCESQCVSAASPSWHHEGDPACQTHGQEREMAESFQVTGTSPWVHRSS